MLKVVRMDVCQEPDMLAHKFQNATPFPHIVIDNFLHEDLAERLLSDFPDISLMHKSHHYLFTQKYELSFWAKASDLFSQLHQDLLSEEFRLFISQVAGKNVFMDFDFCGELHQGRDGSYLDMHVDFNLHPKKDNWVHELTLLIYLNKNWQDQYGGQLLLQHQDQSKVYEIAPIFNRCTIICSDETTFHGYRKLNLPANVTRKSILVNFYREVAPDQIPPRKPTIWATEKVSPLKAGLAKLYNPISTLKHQLFGLTTAGDREDIEKIKERSKNKS
ncbi:2OG-Fe(II) oxygenase [Tumidithrix elongata RA019]|uniref:2OG-Fe(II) oxygenase n=1 Tax=Tumidithrix elongata BACA0141 TaxID=2716417 RepID=A0AAW9PVI7_9CYAN|nr:2OG-Fe(II) oxygenase [Tumidithrix elongata RA019]